MPPDNIPSSPGRSLSRAPRHRSPLPDDAHLHHPPHPASQTTLPSIRSLHPYLPPPVWSQHHSVPDPGNAHDHSRSVPHHQRSPREYSPDQDPHRPKVESGGEEQEQLGPPKKKRRRQALNCTECKRRKIRCDRSQPCGPCSRRGEPGKCQWHVFEPVDKYVTRTEYDELKARVEELEAILNSYSQHHQLPPPPPVGQQHAGYRPMGIPSASTSAGTEAVPPYQYSTGSPAAPTLYHPMMPPPPPPNYAQRTDSLPPTQHSRSSMTESPRPSKRPRPSSPPGSGRMQSPPRLIMTPVITHASSPTLSRLRPAPGGADSPSTSSAIPYPSSSHHPSSSSAPMKSSPHSLASITTPYEREPNPTSHVYSHHSLPGPSSSASSSQVLLSPTQSKNCRAQMLNTTLGGRLRPSLPQQLL